MTTPSPTAAPRRNPATMRVTYATTVELGTSEAPSLHVGGTVAALDRLGYPCHVIAPTHTLLGRPQVAVPGARMLRWPPVRGGWRWYERALARELARTITRQSSDLLYLRCTPGAHICRALDQAQASPTLVVAEVNGTEAVGQALMQAYLRRADVILVDSLENRRRIEEAGVRPRQQFHVQPLAAVDADHFVVADPAIALRRWGKRPQAQVAMMVCGFYPHHDVETALAAIAGLRATRPDLELWLVGDGPERARLESLVAASGHAPLVRWIGRVPHSELPGLLACADVCLDLLTPDKLAEGNLRGFKIAEYLAAGRPTISAIDPALEVPAWATAGMYLVPPRSGEDVARAIATILDDPAAARLRTMAGRDHVLRERTWDHVTAATMHALAAASLDKRRRVGMTPPADAP